MKISCFSGSSIGGSQKAAWSYAVGLANLGHEVVMVTRNGPMSQNFNFSSNSNLRAFSFENDRQLEDFLFGGWPEIVHLHLPGYAIENKVYDILERHGKRPFKVIETNVFGRIKDPRAKAHTDYRLFISMASAAQALKRSRIKCIHNLEIPHGVVYYPVNEPEPISTSERNFIRQKLGLNALDILVIRTGRPDHRKWGAWETKAFSLARKKNSRLHFLQMQPPDCLRQQIESGYWGDGFTCLDLSKSQEEVIKLCQSSDIMLHASRFGESFGYSIAEGMAAGLPVVTLSTPWGDNAQVELVRHSKTGFVCSTIHGLSRAILQLSCDESLRKIFGAASGLRIKTLASLNEECRMISDLCVKGPLSESFKNRTAELINFISEFPSREHNVLEIAPEFGLLTRNLGFLESWVRKKKSALSDIKADIRTSLRLPAYTNI
jgi:glycosyltransferase involved in cell wall biosynthesis